ncbi:hypothetical protein BKA80DRAFT_68040 [Phyllosticta citrichinensis]
MDQQTIAAYVSTTPINDLFISLERQAKHQPHPSTSHHSFVPACLSALPKRDKTWPRCNSNKAIKRKRSFRARRPPAAGPLPSQGGQACRQGQLIRSGTRLHLLAVRALLAVGHLVVRCCGTGSELAHTFPPLFFLLSFLNPYLYPFDVPSTVFRTTPIHSIWRWDLTRALS